MVGEKDVKDADDAIRDEVTDKDRGESEQSATSSRPSSVKKSEGMSILVNVGAGKHWNTKIIL